MWLEIEGKYMKDLDIEKKIRDICNQYKHNRFGFNIGTYKTS